MIEARFTKRFASGFELDVQLQAGAGLTAVFGPSAAGKTLLLDCISGFAKPDAGRLLINDRLLFDADAKLDVPPRERRCGYVFQNYALFPHMTIRENLMFGGASFPGRERHRRTADLLEQFRISDVAERKPDQVSGGQKQRCSIARALAGDPEILLLDEPSRGLDAPLRLELYELLRQISTPCLLVTHSVRECLDLADQMIAIRDGKVVQTGTPAAVAGKPANLEMARLLGIYNVLPAEVRALDPGRNTSLLRVADQDIQGEYIPGRLKGDRLHLLVAPQQLRARPRNSHARGNEITARLVRGTETPYYTLLEFEGGLQVEMPPGDIPHNDEYWIEFPKGGLRVL